MTATGPNATETSSTSEDDVDDSGADSNPHPGDCDAPSADVVSETVSFATSDDKQIVGTVVHPREGTCLPAVLMIHQYMRDRWQWGGLPEQLAERGYWVLAIDLRGHGDSDEQDGYLPELLTDPDQAPLDAEAALQWLRQREEIDDRRIGMVGTSIGAYLAAVAFIQQWGVSPIVALSPLNQAIRGLARHDGDIVLHDLYCIATEHDSDGAQARSCEELVQAATGNVQVEIFDGTADHGIEILEARPELTAPIIDWMVQTL